MIDFLWLRFLYDDWINDDDKLVDGDDADDTVDDNVDDETDIWLFCDCLSLSTEKDHLKS